MGRRRWLVQRSNGGNLLQDSFDMFYSPGKMLDVPCEILGKLDRYVQILEEWSPTLNLIGRRDGSDIWTRHIEDSLQLKAYVPKGTASFVDIGSGAGFPGIPLAIATGMFAHLIESDIRKAAFLEVVISDLNIPARVWNSRIEAVSIPPQPLCTARAVAPLKKLVDLCRPLMLPSSTALFPKGRRYLAEITDVMPHPSMVIRSFPSTTDDEAAVIVVNFQRAAKCSS